MCVDDYQAVSVKAVRPKVCRRFVVEDEDEMSRAYYVNISLFQEDNEELALCKILIYLGRKGLVLDQKKFYMPKFKSIVEPYTFCRIKFDALDETDVFLRSYSKQKDNNEIFLENYELEKARQLVPQETIPCLTDCYLKFENLEESCHFAQPFDCPQPQDCQCMASSQDASIEDKMSSSSSDKEPIEEERPKQQLPAEQEHTYNMNVEPIKSERKSSEEITPASNTRRTREPERVIGEVLYVVKVWRQLHEKKKWSLIQAAKLIGISKKSLDDYFLVLRAGEIQGYDYAGNLNHKMGELRNYLRSKAQKVSGKLKNPFQSFQLIPELNLDQLIEQYFKGNKLQVQVQ